MTLMGRTASSEAIKQDGDALTRKMAERSAKRKAVRGGPRASPSRARAKDNALMSISPTLHGCLTTQDIGFAVNADNVVTAVLQNSPASVHGYVHTCMPHHTCRRTRGVRTSLLRTVRTLKM